MKNSAGGVTGGCNALCGCPVPCPGGNSCGCRTSSKMEGEEQHSKCSCGEHCGCNPCRCQQGTEGSAGGTMRVGKAHCKCGTGCTCQACAA